MYGESYLDEDIDDFDESLSESYVDYDEDYDDYGEAVRTVDRRRNSRGSVRVPSRSGRRPRPYTRPQNGQLTSGRVRSAFRNVGEDVSILDRKVKMTRKNQENEKWLDLASMFLFKPKSINAELESPLKGKDGKEISSIAVGIENNLLPLLLIKLFSGNIGSRNGTNQILPIILILLATSPGTFKDLGLNGLSSSGSTGTATSESQPNSMLLILVLLLFTNKR